MRKVVENTLSPPVDPDVQQAMHNKTQKRKRIEGIEVLTETAVERQEAEERQASAPKWSSYPAPGFDLRIASSFR